MSVLREVTALRQTQSVLARPARRRRSARAMRTANKDMNSKDQRDEHEKTSNQLAPLRVPVLPPSQLCVVYYIDPKRLQLSTDPSSHLENGVFKPNFQVGIIWGENFAFSLQPLLRYFLSHMFDPSVNSVFLLRLLPGCVVCVCVCAQLCTRVTPPTSLLVPFNYAFLLHLVVLLLYLPRRCRLFSVRC